MTLTSFIFLCYILWFKCKLKRKSQLTRSECSNEMTQCTETPKFRANFLTVAEEGILRGLTQTTIIKFFARLCCYCLLKLNTPPDTTRDVCTSPVSVVLQHKLVSDWGQRKRRWAPPTAPSGPNVAWKGLCLCPSNVAEPRVSFLYS